MNIELKPDQIIDDRYTIIEPLGQGGMGVVSRNVNEADFFCKISGRNLWGPRCLVQNGQPTDSWPNDPLELGQ